MKCILFIKDNQVNVMYPTTEFLNLINLSEIENMKVLGNKDVPSGTYYKIINIQDIPSEPQEAWELNLDASNSDGIGLTKEEFEAKYPEYKGMAVQ
jgi:hypothetical protein